VALTLIIRNSNPSKCFDYCVWFGFEKGRIPAIIWDKLCSRSLRNDGMSNNSFEHFFETSPLRTRVEEKLLKVARRMRGDPNWIPTGILSGGRLGFYLWTRKLIMRIWKMHQRPCALSKILFLRMNFSFQIASIISVMISRLRYPFIISNPANTLHRKPPNLFVGS
jgi:hypothetical protein